MLLGELIKNYRFRNDLSQREFANKCGLSNGFISMIENNRNPKTGKPISVSLINLVKLSTAMNIAPDVLLDMADFVINIDKDLDGNRLTPEEAFDKVLPELGIYTAGYTISDEKKATLDEQLDFKTVIDKMMKWVMALPIEQQYRVLGYIGGYLEALEKQDNSKM